MSEPEDTTGPERRPDDQPEDATPKGFSVDLSGGVDEALRTVTEKARQLLRKGQHTKVRIKFRDRELATMPLSMFVAAEAASFLLAGPANLLRILAVNAVGKVLLDVEFVNEADAVVAAGKARLLDGELEEALARFREAVEMDSRHAAAHLNLGIALKLKGQREEALESFERAAAIDPDGDTGREARRQIEVLKTRAP